MYIFYITSLQWWFQHKSLSMMHQTLLFLLCWFNLNILAKDQKYNKDDLQLLEIWRVATILRLTQQLGKLSTSKSFDDVKNFTFLGCRWKFHLLLPHSGFYNHGSHFTLNEIISNHFNPLFVNARKLLYLPHSSYEVATLTTDILMSSVEI